VDGDQHRVEVWTPDDIYPTLESDRLTWHPPGVADALRFELAELILPI
jgi:hypothetical protein